VKESPQPQYFQHTSFVLSAGRTGTIFLADLLKNNFPQNVTVHEPFPSRYEFLLANLRNETNVGKRMVKWLFLKSRHKRLSRLEMQQLYIEINPFLCPMTDLLLELQIPLHVVHIIRNPIDWARSITSFRASRRFRYMIDYVPYARPLPFPRPSEWKNLGELDQALWRWRYCNENISDLRDLCDDYVVIRYEDLFSPSLDLRKQTLRTVLSGLQIELVGDLPEFDISRRLNPAPMVKSKDHSSDDSVRKICGDLMRSFGYDAPS